MSGETSKENLPTTKLESNLESIATPSDGTGHSVWNLSPLPLASDQAVDLRDITPSLSPVFTEDQVRELSQHAADIDVTSFLPPDTFKRITEVLTPEQTNLLISTCTSHYSEHDVSMSYADPLLGSLGQFGSPLKHGTDPMLHGDLPKIDLHDGMFSALEGVIGEEKSDKMPMTVNKSEGNTTVVSSTTTSSSATAEVTSSSVTTSPVTKATEPEVKKAESVEAEAESTKQKDEIKEVDSKDCKEEEEKGKKVKLTPPKPTYSLRSSPRKSQPAEKAAVKSSAKNTRQKSQQAPVAMETRRSPRGGQHQEEAKSPVRGSRGRRKKEDESPKDEDKNIRRSTRAHHEADTTPPKPVTDSPRRGRGRPKAVVPKEEPEKVVDKGDIQEAKVDSSVTLPSDIEMKEPAKEIVDEKKNDNEEEEKKEESGVLLVESENKDVDTEEEEVSPIVDAPVPVVEGENDKKEGEVLKTDTEGESSGTDDKAKHAQKEKKREKKEDLQPSRRSNRIHESIRKREIEEAVRIAQEEMRREREEEDRKIEEEEERIRKEKDEEEQKIREAELEKQRKEDEENARKEEEEEELKRKEEEKKSKEKDEAEQIIEIKPSAASPKVKKGAAEKVKEVHSPKKGKGKEVEQEKGEEKDGKKEVKPKKERKDSESKSSESKSPAAKGKEKIKKEKSLEELKKEKLKRVEEILSLQSGANLFEFHEIKKVPRKHVNERKEEEETKGEGDSASENEEEEVPGDDDSDYDPDNDPERLWCVCRKPHGNRFMICCDTCEGWFHGDCVGITMQIGREMEKTGIEYTCPKCLKAKRANEDGEIKQDLSSDSPAKVNKDGTPITRPRRHTRLKMPKDNPEEMKRPKGTKRLSQDGERKRHKDEPKMQSKEVHKRRSSDAAGYKIPKKVRTTPTPASFTSRQNTVVHNKCITPHCGRPTEASSCYCSDKCIARHAEESLKFLADERKKRLGSHKQQSATSPTSSLHNPMPWESPAPHSASSPRVSERVAVIDKSTGRVIAGVAAPTEGQLFYWLQKHPTFEVLRQVTTVPKEEKKKENKKEEEKAVRENVKRHLKEILSSRLKESKDLHLIDEDISKLAVDIEEEMFKLFGDASHRYKNKYRSLAFNLKDRRNKVLFNHVLSGEVSVERLVGMTPEQLASQELARWRERETKHTLDMITQNIEDINPTKGHIKKTHKGEVELDEYEDLSNLEVHTIDPKAEGADSNTSPGPLLLDTTEQHRVHLFDLNCRICTGKMAPPGEVQHPEEPQPAPMMMISTTSPIIALAESSVPSPPPMDFTDVSSTDTDTQPTPASPPQKSTSTKRVQAVWKGFVMMQSVAKFGTNAYKVSGPCDDLLHLLPDTLHLQGRIGFDQVWDYIYQLRSSTSRVVSVIRYEPSAEDEKTGYVSLYSYFYSRKRCGVVSNCYTGVKDMYLVPLASHAAIPSELLPFDGPGLDEPRPHMLLGIIVRAKPSFKRPRPVSHHKSTSPKAKRKHHHHHSSSSSSSSSSKRRGSGEAAPLSGEVTPFKDSPPPEIDDIVFQFHNEQAKKATEAEGKPSPIHSTGGNSGGSSGISSPSLTPSLDSAQSLAALLAEKQQLLLLHEKAKQLKAGLGASQNPTVADEDTPYDPEEDFDLDLELEKPVNELMDSKKTPDALPESTGSKNESVASTVSQNENTTASSSAAASSIPAAVASTLTTMQTQLTSLSSMGTVTAARPAKPPLLPASLIFPIDMSSSPAAELIKRLISKPGGIQTPTTTSTPSPAGVTAANPSIVSNANISQVASGAGVTATTSGAGATATTTGATTDSPAAASVTTSQVTSGRSAGGILTGSAGANVPAGLQGVLESVLKLQPPAATAGAASKESVVPGHPLLMENPSAALPPIKSRMPHDSPKATTGRQEDRRRHEHPMEAMGISRRQTSDPGPPPPSHAPYPDPATDRRSSAGERTDMPRSDVPRRPMEGAPMESAHRGPSEQQREREHIDRERLEWRERHSRDQRADYGPPSERWRHQRSPPGPLPPRRPDERDSRDPPGPQRPHDERDPYHQSHRRPLEERDPRSSNEPRRLSEDRDPQGHYPRRPSEERAQRDLHGARRPPDERDPRDAHGPRRPSDERDMRDPHGPRRPPDERDPRDAHGPRRPPDERDPRDPHGPMHRRPSEDRHRDPGYGPREGYSDRGRYEPYRRDGRRYEEDRWRDRWRR